MPSRPCALLLAALALPSILPTARASEKPREPLWKVSCTVGGRVVFVAMVPASEVDRKAYEIASAKPGAACVFIGAEDPNAPPDVDGVTAVPFDGVPVDGAEPPLSTGTPGLDTALRALRGDRVGVSAPPPPRSEPDRRAGEIYAAPTAAQGATDGVPEKPSPPSEDPSAMRPKDADWVRLALYSGAGRMDAFADWRRILSEDRPLFASLTPSIVETRDYVMLTVGPVAPDERVDLCMSALGLAVDCVFGDEERMDDGAVSMGDFLAAAGGEEVATSRRRPPSVLDAMQACGSDDDAFEGRQCWRSPFAMAQASRLPLGEPARPNVPVSVVVPSAPVALLEGTKTKKRKPRPIVGLKAQLGTMRADVVAPRT